MSIYTQTSLKAVKKGDLVQLYLELQGKYIDIQMECEDKHNYSCELGDFIDKQKEEKDKLKEEKDKLEKYKKVAAEELQEVKEAANRLLTASEQQVISLKEKQDDDSESNYKYITTLEDEVEELKTERDNWRTLAKCWEKKNEKKHKLALRDAAALTVESWAGDAGGEGFEGFDYR